MAQAAGQPLGRPRAIGRLRLICEREAEIEVFRPREYWSVEAGLATKADGRCRSSRPAWSISTARSWTSSTWPTKPSAEAAVERLSAARVTLVEKVERKKVSGATRSRPSPPRPCSRRPRASWVSAPRGPCAAQKLYEGVDLGGETVGLITYMRTDGVQLSEEAVAGARET